MKLKFIVLIFIFNLIIPFYITNSIAATDSADERAAVPVPCDTILSDKAADENISGSSLETIEIYEVVKADTPLQFFPLGEKIESIETYSYITVVSADYYYYQCDIDWDDPHTIDTSSSGRKVLKGKVIPPEGFSFEYDIYAELPLIVYDSNNENAETLAPYTGITNYNSDSITIVEVYSDISEYLEHEMLLFTKNGDAFYCPVKWDIVPITDTGYYNIKGHLMLPKGITAENPSDTIVTKPFYSMKSDKIYIEPYYIVGNSIRFPWLKEIEDCEKIILQYSLDNEHWENDDGTYGFADSTYLFISTLFMSYDKDHYFRLLYNGEYTDTVKINISTMEIYNIEGDRDGGDNSHQEVPVPEQTAPSGGHGSSSLKVSGVKESSTENSLTVSGKRLKDMANTAGGKISVEKEGIEVKIPSDFINNNNISDTDSVAITIDKKENSTFDISLNINDIEIKDIPGTEVYVPANDASKPVKISIDTTGEYSITNTDNNSTGNSVHISNNTAGNNTYNTDNSEGNRPDTPGKTSQQPENDTKISRKTSQQPEDNTSRSTFSHYIIPALLIIFALVIAIGRKIFYGREQI